MDFPIEYLKASEFPRLLKEIPKPPETLNYRGQLPHKDTKLLAVVGSRHYTNYGAQVVDYLIGGLSGHNIGIVSGLAIGIDSLAHEAALKNHLYTLAIPGGGIANESIYPARHKPLAKKILENGGGLLSEFAPEFQATNWSFPQRNRLVCGIANATLIIEAGEKSGTLITAKLTADFNRELLVVPGNIFSDNSKGVHQFLKLGATPITDPKDILDVLGLEVVVGAPRAKPAALSTLESHIYEALREPLERDALIRKLDLDTSTAAIILMQMELSGHIVEDGGIYRRK